MDPRELKLPSVDLSILDGIKDANQREILKSAMESSTWRMAEFVARVDEVEKENKKLQAVAAEGELALDESKALRSRLAFAEHALNAEADTRRGYQEGEPAKPQAGGYITPASD